DRRRDARGVPQHDRPVRPRPREAQLLATGAEEGFVTSEPARRKVLVMGASGFVGSHVTRKLVERGDDVRVYLRKSSVTVAIDDLDVERWYGDLRDETALAQAFSDRDAVFYC